MTFVPGKSVADLQIDSVREAFTLQCGVSTAAVTFVSKPLHGCPSWDLTARRLHATTSTKAQMKIFLENSVEDLVAAASSAAFSASVGTGLSIINAPYVAFGVLVDSSLATLTVTSLGHVTEVLSPAFDVGTLFYQVNVTSLTYTVDASARSDAATGFEVNGKAAHAIYTVHSTAPAYQEIEGACLGPRCNHNNLHRARLLSALSWS